MKKLGGLPKKSNKASTTIDYSTDANNQTDNSNDNEKVFELLNDIADSNISQIYAMKRIEQAYKKGEISYNDKQFALQQINEYYRS